MSNSANLDDLLRCPKCHAAVVRDGDRYVCTNEDVRLAYPIRDDIPVMIESEASELSIDEWRAVIERSHKEVPE